MLTVTSSCSKHKLIGMSNPIAKVLQAGQKAVVLVNQIVAVTGAASSVVSYLGKALAKKVRTEKTIARKHNWQDWAADETGVLQPVAPSFCMYCKATKSPETVHANCPVFK